MNQDLARNGDRLWHRGNSLGWHIVLEICMFVPRGEIIVPELLRRLHEIAKSEITGEFINLRSEFPEDAGELWAIHSILTAAHHYDTGDLQWDDDQSLHTFSIEVYFPMPTYRKGRKADNE